MPSLTLPFLLLAIAFPLACALFLKRVAPSRQRIAAVGSAIASLLMSLGAAAQLWNTGEVRLADPFTAIGPLQPLLTLDALGAFALIAYTILAVVLLSALPRRDAGTRDLQHYLLILTGAIAVYAADNLVVLLAGWVVTLIPTQLKDSSALGEPQPRWRLPQMFGVFSTACLIIAFVLMMGSAWRAGIEAGLSISRILAVPGIGDHVWTLVFLFLAILPRKGIVPFHSWVLVSVERGDFLKTVALLNSHLGIFVMARLAIPLLPYASENLFRPLTDLALVTSVVTALMALASTKPRNAAALIYASQSSFILAGIGSGTVEGITGALLHWAVVILAATSVFLVIRLLEVRVSYPLSLREHHGFTRHAPRLAVFFLMSALALVGLPGTLGFCAEDLMLHGTLETHPVFGILLPIATAINAVSLLRLYNRLFLGKRGTLVPRLLDALPRERWSLALVTVLVIAFGLFPSPLVKAISRPVREYSIRLSQAPQPPVSLPLPAHTPFPDMDVKARF
jgi:NADH-quinone oxidoreductase subunit M